MILEYKSGHPTVPYVIVGKGFPRSVHYSVTRATVPTAHIHFLFEERESTKLAQYTISAYNGGVITKGTYLGSVTQRNGKLLHYFYEKTEVKE